MEQQGGDEKWQEIRDIHRKHPFFYEMAAGILVVIIGALIGLAIFPNDPGYRSNLYTTGLGVLITIFVLDRMAEHRSEKKLKEALIRQMGSRSNDFAIDGVRQIRDFPWLKDGSLNGQFSRKQVCKMPIFVLRIYAGHILFAETYQKLILREQI